MKTSTILILVGVAGVAFFLYKRRTASLDGTAAGGTIINPTAWRNTRDAVPEQEPDASSGAFS